MSSSSPLELAVTFLDDSKPEYPFGEGVETFLIGGSFGPPLNVKDASSLAELGDLVDDTLSGIADRGERLAWSAALLCAYVQDNYTGPAVTASLCDAHERVIIEVSRSLQSDGERCASTARSIHLLWMARRALYSEKSPSPCWWLWRARACARHRELLDGRSGSLWKDEDEALINAQSLGVTVDLERVRWLVAQDRLKEAKRILSDVRDKMGLVVRLTGKMGRRTKYQTFDVAQLVVEVEKDEEEAEAAGVDLGIVEIGHEEDNPLLERIRLSDGEDVSRGGLTCDQQAEVLLEGLVASKEGARDEQRAQVALPYVVAVVEGRRDWAVHTAALWVRSALEGHWNKTRDRAALQMDALSKQWGDGDGCASLSPACTRRMRYFWTLPFPSRHELRYEAAKAFLRLGAASSAAELFHALGRTEDEARSLVVCGRAKEAEQCVLDVIAKSPERYELLCWLADLRGDPSLLEKAWKESGQKCAVAMRQLGRHHHRAQRWDEAAQCFELALMINSGYPEIHFQLGVARLQLGLYQEAAGSFAAAVHGLPEDGQAWANLSVALQQCGKLEEALTAAEQACRHAGRDWRMWENMLKMARLAGKVRLVARACRQMCLLHGDVPLVALAWLVEAGDIPPAELKTILDQWIDEKPDDARLYALRAEHYATQKDGPNTLLDCGRQLRLLKARLQHDVHDGDKWRVLVLCLVRYAQFVVALGQPRDAKSLIESIKLLKLSVPQQSNHPNTHLLDEAIESMQTLAAKPE